MIVQVSKSKNGYAVAIPLCGSEKFLGIWQSAVVYVNGEPLTDVLMLYLDATSVRLEPDGITRIEVR